MNRKTLLKLIVLGMLPIVQTACENAQNAAIENLVYISMKPLVPKQKR